MAKNKHNVGNLLLHKTNNHIIIIAAVVQVHVVLDFLLLLALREKANLAVTLANEKDDILAHASFFDHPVGDLVDQARWEPFLQKHFSAENCTVCIIFKRLILFINLFIESKLRPLQN